MIDDTLLQLTPCEWARVRAWADARPADSRFRAPYRRPAAVTPSMRAFRAALHDACRARLCRRQAKRAASPWHRARLLQIALQCEARVRHAADLAMRAPQ